MDNATVACVQQRMRIHATHEEFEAEVRRFLHQAQAKSTQLVVFPELTGLMLAPPLISGFKLGFIKHADKSSQPTAGFMRRRLGQVSGAAADVLGGGFRGSLVRLLDKKSDALRDAYFETFGRLASDYGMAILAGSLYLRDPETGALRNRAYLFDVDGEVLGYQDKFNLSSDEEDLATPGMDLNPLQTRFGRLGVLIGRDALYPELARLLAVQGVELLVGIAASPGAAQANVFRSALALRTEENQVLATASFLLGSNYLGQANREDYFGQSALLAPISLTTNGDGVLVQTGTNRTEGLIATELPAEALHSLWENSRFRPRQEMNLGSLGPILSEFYLQGLTLQRAIELRIAGPAEFEPTYPEEPTAEPLEPTPTDLIEQPLELEKPESAEPAEPPQQAGQPGFEEWPASEQELASEIEEQENERE